jgi:general secretion pathway protein G
MTVRIANVITLMCIVVVIFLVVGACLQLFMGKDSRREMKPCEVRVSQDLRVLRDAMELYRSDTGVLPNSMQDLMECPDNLEGWSGPYLKRFPKDPWNEEYLIFKSQRGVWVGTFGADRLPGAEEDFFIDIITGNSYQTERLRNHNTPYLLKWGWLLPTGVAVVLAIALFHVIRRNRTSK